VTESLRMAASNPDPSNVETASGGAQDAPRARSEAAKRALAEAEERRARDAVEAAREYNGRGGHDPARYGDWEIKGIASDF
jgi:hypothetical protein